MPVSASLSMPVAAAPWRAPDTPDVSVALAPSRAALPVSPARANRRSTATMAGASETCLSLADCKTCVARRATRSSAAPLPISPATAPGILNTACHTSCHGICSVPASIGVRPTVSSVSLATIRADARTSDAQPAPASATSSACRSANQRCASAGRNAWSSASICAVENCRTKRAICTSRDSLANNKRRTASTSPDSTRASSASSEAPVVSGCVLRRSGLCPTGSRSCSGVLRPSSGIAVAVAAYAGNRPSRRN